MTMLQPIQYALPGIAPQRAPVAAETAVAVPGTAAGERAQGDVPRDRGAEAERIAAEARALLDDPRRPVGPPPAFRANVLEAERARLMEPDPPARSGDPEAAPEPAAEAGEPPAPVEAAASATPYGDVPTEEPPRSLDMSR